MNLNDNNNDSLFPKGDNNTNEPVSTPDINQSKPDLKTDASPVSSNSAKQDDTVEQNINQATFSGENNSEIPPFTPTNNEDTFFQNINSDVIENSNNQNAQNGYNANQVPFEYTNETNSTSNAYPNNNDNGYNQNSYSNYNQATGYTNNGYNTYDNGYNYNNSQQNNQQNPNQWQQPVPPQQTPQQTQWTFNDYGPMGSENTKPNKAKKAPKTAKDPKPPKKNSGTGIKIFAVIVSVLLVASVSTFVWYALFGGDNLLNNGTTSSQPNADANKPQIDINNTPSDSDTPPIDNSGRMTTPAVNKAVRPSVVGIVTYVKSTGYQVSGEGSGVIISSDGYIVTNAHVIESSDPRIPVAKVEVVLDNDETYTAQIVGSDTKTDLAVLKIQAKNLSPATFGNSDNLEVGETVIVIGNPNGLEFAGSLTQGVVSALNRQINLSGTVNDIGFIQTDAAINPGNSGGALVNQYGQVIGINSAKVVKEGYEGIGFAIPINTAKPIVDSIIQNGYVAGRVKIGITYKAVTETLANLNGIPVGLRVVDFEIGSEVDLKGVLKGDIITKMDGKDTYDAETINAVLKGKKPGDTLRLSIYRVDDFGRAQNIEIDIILQEDLPENINK